MDNAQYEALAALALTMGLTPANAEALPAVVETAARKSGRSDAFILAACQGSEGAELRAYLAGVCRTVCP